MSLSAVSILVVAQSSSEIPEVLMNNPVTKIKKILLYEMKFLVQNYSCLQNPLLGATVLRFPFSLSLTEFIETSPNKIPG